MSLETEIELRSLEIDGISNLRQGNYQSAEALFRKQYGMMLTLQDLLNQRFHKGGPLHNLGISLLFQGKTTEGIRYLILAYIEDLITAEEKLEVDEAPACRVLRGLCGAVWQDLDPFYEVVAKLKTKEKELRDPEKVYERVAETANRIIERYQRFLRDTWQLEVKAQRAIQEREFEVADQIYLKWYEILTFYQKQRGAKVHAHKGHVLANRGFINAHLDPKRAMHYYLLAYIEDVLSERKEGRARTTSAFQALTKGFRFPISLMELIEKIIRQGKLEGRDQSLPENELSRIMQKGVVQEEQAKKIDTTGLESSAEAPKPKRSIDDLPGSFKTRVFIGGGSANENTLRQIGEYVENSGLSPIIALDYEPPKDDKGNPLMNVHDLDIHLIAYSRWAIFELSTAAAQFEEIAWSVRMLKKPTYGVKTVRSPRLSDHIHDLLKEAGNKLFEYHNNSELRKHIEQLCVRNK